MGYGRTSAANGKVFPWVFNLPATYWSQATVFIKYIGEKEGGLGKLKGKKIALVYHNSAYGKEPIRTLEKMSEKFEQLSNKPGFMKHNGGLLFRKISENEYEFKVTINENHLNAAGIVHGGFISAIVDAGAGTAAHRAASNSPCVTISLELKFISAVKMGQELIGITKIQKKTKSMIFLTCELISNNKSPIVK